MSTTAEIILRALVDSRTWLASSKIARQCRLADADVRRALHELVSEGKVHRLSRQQRIVEVWVACV